MNEDKYGITNRLIENGIIDATGKILNEPALLEFLFGLFLFYLGFERYKKLFDDAIESQRKAIIKGQKPHPFALPAFPFRFVGIGNKTIFIGKMARPYELFTDILQTDFFWNYNHIDRMEPFIDPAIIQRGWKKHTCKKNYLNKYCPDCKPDFSNLVCSSFPEFSKSFGIDSYLVLDIPANVFEEIISQEGLIELQQYQPSCSCGAILEKEWIFCPFCSEKVDSAIFEDEIDAAEVPEKSLNIRIV